MKKITYDTAVQELLNTIPEINSYQKLDEDELNSPVMIFDMFGTFLLAKILSQCPQDNVVIIKSFEFINQVMLSTDPRLHNLVVVGVFEAIGGSALALETAQNFLTGNAKDWLDKVKENFIST